MKPTPPEPKSAAVIVLDGASSTRPELADLIDLSVLVETPVSVRHERLAVREDKEFLAAWHARWDAAEEHYCTPVRPKAAFLSGRGDLLYQPTERMFSLYQRCTFRAFVSPGM